MYCFWRENHTPSCKEIGTNRAIFGGLYDSVCIGVKQRVLVNDWHLYFDGNGDMEQAPVIMKHNEKYWLYAAWYEYEPNRKGRGIAIYESSTIENPHFRLVDTIPLSSSYVCDKLASMRIDKTYFYIPFPGRHDFWHFDLFEYEGDLYMVSSAEGKDNIMLSVSNDWKHFQTYRKPLINAHCMTNKMGGKVSRIYKPTAFVQHDSLYLYYTARDNIDRNKNNLYLSKIAMKDIKH